MAMDQIETIPKVWGQEVVIVNNDLYCGKFLCFDKEAKGSLHLHRKKTETFLCIEGEAELWVEDTGCRITAETQPVTILRGQKHQVTAVTACMILEISTPHSDGDVERFTRSERGIV